MLARPHLFDVGQRQRTLRFVVGRAANIAFKQAADGTFTAGNNHQIRTACTVFQIADICCLNPQFPTTFLELFHPARDLHSLVHGLRVVVQPCRPVDVLAANRIGHRKTDPFNPGTLLFPEIQSLIALGLECGVEHTLAGHHSARADRFGGTLREENNFVTFSQQSQAKLQAGLAGADNGDAAHN
ncbi:MAG TPA: hypothetical protein VKE24_15505 [Candidatus Acidoferrales bacterium]|nr:hypothetical protein [Candidatus Acidoferrales bacterium]